MSSKFVCACTAHHKGVADSVQNIRQHMSTRMHINWRNASRVPLSEDPAMQRIMVLNDLKMRERIEAREAALRLAREAEMSRRALVLFILNGHEEPQLPSLPLDVQRIIMQLVAVTPTAPPLRGRRPALTIDAPAAPPRS